MELSNSEDEKFSDRNKGKTHSKLLVDRSRMLANMYKDIYNMFVLYFGLEPHALFLLTRRLESEHMAFP